MTTKAKETTAEELLQMPNDGFRYELVRGELVKMSPAGHQHGKIAAILIRAVIKWMEYIKLNKNFIFPGIFR